MAYDILSLTGYKRICTCANMVSDITVVIQDDSITSDNTWSSSKIATEISLAKESIRQYIKDDNLKKIDISITNIMPSEDKMKENTMYLVKVFNEEDFTQVLYYKIYMKFDDNIAFLGDSNIGKSDIYTKEETDNLFFCSQLPDENDNLKGLSAGAIYRIINQINPVQINNANVYPILCDRKNNSHAENFIIGLQNFSDRFEGSITYKVMNGLCHVKFDITTKDIYISNLLEYQILNDKTLPRPVSILGNAAPCTILTCEAEYSDKIFAYITKYGGIILRGSGNDDVSTNKHFKGSLIYSVM